MATSTYVPSMLMRTLDNGGDTFDRLGRQIPAPTHDWEPRYVVGGARDIPALQIPDFSRVSIRDAVNMVAAFLARNAHHGTFGSWVDPDTGILWIDAVDIFTSATAAAHAAVKRDEIAIFDLFTGETIGANS